jgi:hypothetical protein
MVAAGMDLSLEDAERFRSFERERHDSLAATQHDFFTPVTALGLVSTSRTFSVAVRQRAGYSPWNSYDPWRAHRASSTTLPIASISA